MSRRFTGGAAVLVLIVMAAAAWAKGLPVEKPNPLSRIAALEETVAVLQDTVADLQDSVAVIQVSETFAYAARGLSSPTPLVGSPGSSLIGLSVPAGDYVVVGKVVVGNHDRSAITQVSCQIHNDGAMGGSSLLDQTGAWLPPEVAYPTAGGYVTLSFAGSISLEEEPGRPGPAFLSVHCTTNNPPEAWGQFASLTAVRVTSLIQQ